MDCSQGDGPVDEELVCLQSCRNNMKTDLAACLSSSLSNSEIRSQGRRSSTTRRPASLVLHSGDLQEISSQTSEGWGSTSKAIFSLRQFSVCTYTPIVNECAHMPACKHTWREKDQVPLVETICYQHLKQRSIYYLFYECLFHP